MFGVDARYLPLLIPSLDADSETPAEDCVAQAFPLWEELSAISRRDEVASVFISSLALVCIKLYMDDCCEPLAS